MKPDHLCRVGKGKAPAKLARSAGASPAQVRPSKPPGSECCVRRQQCRTRSVHSGCVGCVIEPRNTLAWGRRLSFAAERHMGRTVMRGTVHPAGVEEHITRKRIASEPGRSCV